MTKPLEAYPNLGDFFYRELKPGLRVIEDAEIVSPADGLLTHFGVCTGDSVEQVKGLQYSLKHLLDGDTTPTPPNTDIKCITPSHFNYIKRSLQSQPNERVVFRGSVSRTRRLPSLPLTHRIPRKKHKKVSRRIVFSESESRSMASRCFRIEHACCLGWCLGTWVLRHGCCWLVDLKLWFIQGATNVGTIVVNEGVEVLKKGDEMGGFRMGSSIVLVFEGPRGLSFVDVKDKIRVGQRMIDNAKK